MNTANFELLYDITQASAPNLHWLGVAGAALAVALAVRWRRRRQGSPVGTPTFFAACFGLFLAVVVFSVWDHHRLVDTLQAGQAQVIEGPVQSFTVTQRAVYNSQSKRYDRSVTEAFYVGPLAFGYVRDGSAAGFTNAASPTLALADGQVLRVHFAEDTPGDFASRRILRLERLQLPAATAVATKERG